MNLSRYSLLTVTVRFERFHPAPPEPQTKSTVACECQSIRWSAFEIVEARLGFPASTNARVDSSARKRASFETLPAGIISGAAFAARPGGCPTHSHTRW